MCGNISCDKGRWEGMQREIERVMMGGAERETDIRERMEVVEKVVYRWE